MAIARISRGPRVVVLGLGLGGLVPGPVPGPIATEARADLISLRGGGQIRGKVVADPDHPDRVVVLTERGKTPLTFQKARIVHTVAEPSALDEYVILRAKAAMTAEAQYELGLWCEQHTLSDLAALHYEAAVARDKTFAAAHRKLGHVPSGCRWLTADEVREAQGLVRYKGKWISQQERDRREVEAASAAEQASWARRIRLLRQAVVFGPEDRRREAESHLMEIRDPIAVDPLVRVLGNDASPLRILLDHVLGLIPGPEAAAALVTRILGEADPDVRHVTLGELEQREEPNVIPALVRALRSNNPAVINRAAWTLSNLNVVSAVPRLIPALMTTQYRVVITNSGGSAPAPSPASYGVPIATPSGIRGPVPKIVPIIYQNVEVLAALIHLTGQNFGFDAVAWSRWVGTSFQADANPVRRVPQP